MNNAQLVTCGIKHWDLSGYLSVLPHIKFGVTGQESTRNPNDSYRHPLSAIPLGLQITWLGLEPSVCPSGQTDNIELM